MQIDAPSDVISTENALRENQPPTAPPHRRQDKVYIIRKGSALEPTWAFAAYADALDPSKGRRPLRSSQSDNKIRLIPAAVDADSSTAFRRIGGGAHSQLPTVIINGRWYYIYEFAFGAFIKGLQRAKAL